MSIDLEDRERWDATPIGGLYVHVVEGVAGWIHGDSCPDDGCAYTTVAPPELIAISEQKCETCGGNGSGMAPSTGYRWIAGKLRPLGAGAQTYAEIRCHDCAGSGRPLVEVMVPCECACHRLHSKYPGISHDVLGECKRDGSCIDGRLSIGRGTVEAVVPIVSMLDAVNYMRYPCISVNTLANEPDVIYELSATEFEAEIDLGPNPEQYVGSYGVIVRRQA